MGRRRCRWATPAATRAEGAVVFAWVEEDVRVAPAWAEGGRSLPHRGPKVVRGPHVMLVVPPCWAEGFVASF